MNPTQESPGQRDTDPLDGNAAAGVLGQLFSFELTTASVVCGGCGSTRPLGALLLYGHAMGTILRCPECDQVLIRVVAREQGYWLDMRGVASLRAGPRVRRDVPAKELRD